MKRPESLLIREHLEYLVQQATDQTHGDISAAAKLLGIDRTTLSRWVNHGLKKTYYRGDATSGASSTSSSPD